MTTARVLLCLWCTFVSSFRLHFEAWDGIIHPFPDGVKAGISNWGRYAPSEARSRGVLRTPREICERLFNAGDVALLGNGNCEIDEQMHIIVEMGGRGIIASEKMMILSDTLSLPLFIINQKDYEELERRAVKDLGQVFVQWTTKPIWNVSLPAAIESALKMIETLSHFQTNEYTLNIQTTKAESSEDAKDTIKTANTQTLECVVQASLQEESYSFLWNYLKQALEVCDNVTSLCEAALTGSPLKKAFIEKCILSLETPQRAPMPTALAINGRPFLGPYSAMGDALCDSLPSCPPFDLARSERLLRGSSRSGEDHPNGPLEASSNSHSYSSSHSASGDSCSSVTCIAVLSSVLGFVLIVIFVLLFTLIRKKLKEKEDIPQPAQDFTQIPASTFTPSMARYGATQCPICLEEFTEGVLVKFTICQHVFHDTCLNSWLRKCDGAPRCPECSQNPYESAPEKAVLSVEQDPQSTSSSDPHKVEDNAQEQIALAVIG